MSQTTSGGGGFSTITTLLRLLVQAMNGVASALSALRPYSQQQGPNLFYATPASGDGVPGFRAIATSDLPSAVAQVAESQAANTFFAAPASGSGLPGFRAITGGDISDPTFTGTVTVASFTATGTLSGAGFIALLAPYAQTQNVFAGGGVSWRNVSASRSLGTTYTNTLPRPIKIMIDVTSSAYPCFLMVNVNGAVIPNGPTSASQTVAVAFEVPPGQTYEVTLSAGTSTGLNWSEL
jgi:hypothetical protein